MKKYIVKENGETVGVFLNAGQACALNDEYLKYGRSCTIDIVSEPDETETEPGTADETNEEEKTMEKYNYMNAMLDDVRDYIAENIDRADYIGNREELEEKLYDDCFIADSVTGNASGSYYCNAYRAEQALAGNLSLLAEALDEFGSEPEEYKKALCSPEYADCTIRCYLVGQAVAEVLDELEDSGYFEESETDESDICALTAAKIETA
jgi:uncharacterized protein YcgL (UPF0745 family)